MFKLHGWRDRTRPSWQAHAVQSAKDTGCPDTPEARQRALRRRLRDLSGFRDSDSLDLPSGDLKPSDDR